MSKRKALAFTCTMCLLMASTMSAWALWLRFGFFPGFFRQWLLHLPLGCAVAVALEWFLVGRLVKDLHGKLVPPSWRPGSPAFVISLSFLMVLAMVSLMCGFVSLMETLSGSSRETYGHRWVRLFPAALALQLALVGPLVRAMFLRSRTVPEGTCERI